MDYLKHALQTKQREFESLLKEAERQLNSLPEGSIRVAPRRGKVHYYERSPKDIEKKHYNGRYIRKKDTDKVTGLCNRQYWEEIRQSIKEQNRHLIHFAEAYDSLLLEKIYACLSPAIAKFVQPIVLPENEYVRRWESEEYRKKPFAEGTAEIFSERGERVRSKSEKIIADTLARMGIPYKYEKPFMLSTGNIIHPDFCLLNVSQRKEYLFEHFGRMDDPDYLERALSRINDYEREGIFPGKQLLVTYETRLKPLDTKLLKKLLTEFLKK